MKALAFVLLLLVTPASSARSSNNEVSYEDAEACVGKVRSLISSRIHPQDGSLTVEDYEYGTGTRLQNGLVLTAKHVVWIAGKVSSRVEFWHSGKRHYTACRILVVDHERDISVLHCPASSPGRLKLATKRLQTDGVVYVAGYPSYRYDHPRLLLSRGFVTSTSYSLPGADEIPERANLVAVDAPAYGGESGGAIFDASFKLLAVLTKANQTGSGAWNGASFGISAKELASIIETAKMKLKPVKGYEFLEPQ